MTEGATSTESPRAAYFWLIVDNNQDSHHAGGRRGTTHSTWRATLVAVPVISLLLIVGLVPTRAHASIFDAFMAAIVGTDADADTISAGRNVQTMPLLRAAMNSNPTPARGGGDIIIVDDSALMPEEGPSGTIADIERPKNGSISIYVVQRGDTLSEIAEMFDVTPSTILWANDLPRGSQLQIGQKLVILPVTGVKHTVKKGDTLASIAKKYGGDADEIVSFNGLDGDLVVGSEIVIPNGEIQTPAPKKSGSSIVRSTGPIGTSVQVGYYMRPIVGGVRTQGVHGYNGVDLAAPVGTPIIASAEGDVIVAKEGGWNGGYGSYIVIQHDNGSQTLYAHESRVAVSIGDHVQRGQVIGYMGATGKATGSHVHFEIRNGIRNPF